MYARKVASIAALSSLALMSAAVNARAACWYPNEARAAQVHAMNIQLMVGSLHCQKMMPEFIQDYDHFSERHRQTLDAQGYILNNRFSREEGGERGDGKPAFDRYSTSLANSYATDPVRPVRQRCARLNSLAKVAAQLEPEQLTMLASSLMDQPLSSACAPSSYSYAGQTLSPQPAQAEVVFQEEQPAMATMEDGVLTYTSPHSPRDTGYARPVPLASAGQPIASPSPAEEARSAPATKPKTVSQADALQNAVTALQAATAALQMTLSSQNGSAASAPADAQN